LSFLALGVTLVYILDPYGPSLVKMIMTLFGIKE